MTRMPATSEDQTLDLIAVQNEIALRQARRMLDFLRLLAQREAQVLQVPAQNTTERPDDSPPARP